MTLYPNAKANAADAHDLPLLTADYQPQSIEFFFGDVVPDSTFHWRNGQWFGINLDHMLDPQVLQVLVDGNWAYICTPDGELLDRLGGLTLPPVPSADEIKAFLAKKFAIAL
jgi:hypothetical protein